MPDGAISVGKALVKMLPDFRGFGSKVSEGLAPVTTKLQGVASTMSRTLTPAALAVGAAFAAAFQEFDSGVDRIRVGTGATGKALEGLTTSAKNVAAGVASPFSQVGEAIASLNSRLGLTGKPLEQMATQFLNLSRITGTDLKSNIESVTRAFGDWGLAGAEAARGLDTLFRTSQQTGVAVDRLAQLVVKFGAPMRAFGFSFEQAAALMGKFEQEGVNTELVMSGLRIALGRFSGQGEEAREELEGLQENLAGAKDGMVGLGDGVRSAADRLGDLRQAVVDAAQNIVDLRDELKDAKADVGEAFEGAHEKVEDYGDAVEDAADRLNDLNGNVVRARSRIADLQKELVKAKKALDDALGGAAPRDVEEASLALEEARIREAEAANELEDAEKDLAEARKKGDPEDIERAELRVRSARVSVREAALRLVDAERELSETRQKGTEQDQEVIEARERLAEVSEQLGQADADLDSAIKDQIEGRKELAKAEREYNEIRARGLEADEGVIAARQRVEDITRRIADAERAHGEALENVVDGQRDLARANADYAKGAAEVAKAQREVNDLLSVRAPGSPQEALLDVFEKIKNLSDEEGLNLANKVFGKRAGTDFFRAIKEGRFDVDKLVESIANGRDTINEAAKETDDWQESLDKLRNKIVTSLGPIGQIGAVVAGGLSAIGPALLGISAIFPKLLPAIGSGLASLFSAPAILTAVGTGIGVLTSFLLSKLPGMVGNVVRALVTLNPATRIIGVLSIAMRAGFASFFDGVRVFFTQTLPNFFTQTIPRAFGSVTGFFQQLPGRIGALLGSIPGIVGGVFSRAMSAMSSAVFSGAGAVLNFFASMPGRIAGFFSDIGTRFFEVGRAIFSGILRGMLWVVEQTLGRIPIIGDDIVDAFRNFFGIRSPSKVMTKVGEQVGEGLRLGVSQSLGRFSLKGELERSMAGLRTMRIPVSADVTRGNDGALSPAAVTDDRLAAALAELGIGLQRIGAQDVVVKLNRDELVRAVRKEAAYEGRGSK